ncbi:MAG: hypothetical protein G8237_05600 [Magnetococcales bacterium]|nr:hypothetical protein [Magnetococcales bacterium]
MSWLNVWPLMIPLMPGLAALWIGGVMGARNQSERHTAWIALTSMMISLLGIVTLDLWSIWQGLPGHRIWQTWWESGGTRITISWLLDLPALVMTTLVALGCLTAGRFGINYMHREPGFHRFFATLCLFASGMFWIALAGNALLTFVGWELAGVASFLLISYARERTTAAENATRALMTNRFGDAGMLFSLAMTLAAVGSVEWPRILNADFPPGAPPIPIILLGFLVAALAKSAQIPFFAWIARALEGPTPSSALFYGSLLAHAGVFLVIRLEPLLWHSPMWMTLLMLLGLTTAILAPAIGRVQSDVKSALIFSTQAQIGWMFFACGAGLFDLALVHMTMHASWRFYQFLLAPSYLQQGGMTARQVPGWLARSRSLYHFALQRGWFDNLTDALITRPTLALAQDARLFEEVVVNRIAGRPTHEIMLAQRAEWDDPLIQPLPDAHAITQGRGLFGRLLEKMAHILSWFEERLVLNSSGDGLVQGLRFLGDYLRHIDLSLGKPRYLILMIVLTFLVIL